LRELSLAGCSEIDDTGFPPGDDVRGIEDYANMSGNRNDDRIIAVPSPSLMTTLLGPPIMSPSPLSYPPALTLFDHLRYLDLTSLSLLTDTALEGIVKYMPRIRNLILAKCVGITDLGVESICKLGKALHYLHLGHVSS
jgi:F-box and leucine-rich repeat protein GRR1